MTHFLKFLSLSLCVLILSNCASRKEIVSLPDSVKKEIGGTDIYLKECNKKMSADVESSNISSYVGGGLLLGLIDGLIVANRVDNANNALVDVNKELETFNFQEKFNNKLIRILQNTNWLHVRQVNHITDISDKAIEEILKKENSDCVLTSQFIYKFNPKFNVMTGTVYLSLYPTSQKIKKMVKAENPLETPIFRFHASATEALSQTGSDIQENAKIWAQNNGLYLRKAFDNILYQIFMKLDKVLKNPDHLPEG